MHLELMNYGKILGDITDFDVQICFYLGIIESKRIWRAPCYFQTRDRA